MKLTPEQVDTISPDVDEPADTDDARHDRFLRHWYFAHFCLGEPWGDAAAIASRFYGSPLSLSVMRDIAEDWDDGGERGE